MYLEKFVAVVKADGKVLREIDGAVRLPFGSEFSIQLKNMNTVRALVTIEIDGVDATENVELVVPANDTLELERFIKNGNLTAGHKFKFIERTEKIENGPRGIKAEDGLIRIQFEFEKEQPPIYVPRDVIWKSTPLIGTTIYDAAGTAEIKTCGTIYSNAEMTLGTPGVAGDSTATTLQNDVGITVPGGVSSQTFNRVYGIQGSGKKHVIVLRLLGSAGKIEKPVTVKTKVECPTCGTKNTSAAKFCSECGTGLIEV